MLRALRPVSLVCVVVAPLAGCDLLGLMGGDIDIPIDLTTPDQDFDVAGPVASAEESACSDAGSEECAALRAICETDAGRDCTSPTMPDQFPAQVEVVPGEAPLDANQLMADLGITEATEMELALPVDVASALAEEGVSDPGLAKNVSIGALTMEWPDNSLTFDLPPLDLYIADEAIPEGTLDAEALIAAGTVTKVGTVGLDLDEDGEIDVGQVAGSTDPVPVSFVDGGTDLLSEALKSAEFTVVTAVPAGRGLSLKETGDGAQVLKPNGAGKVRLKATLIYTLSASDILAAAQ